MLWSLNACVMCVTLWIGFFNATIFYFKTLWIQHTNFLEASTGDSWYNESFRKSPETMYIGNLLWNSLKYSVMCVTLHVLCVSPFWFTTGRSFPWEQEVAQRCLSFFKTSMASHKIMPFVPVLFKKRIYLKNNVINV